jgi:hypothetical protein
MDHPDERVTEPLDPLAVFRAKHGIHVDWTKVGRAEQARH